MSKINQISVDGVIYDIATKKEVELEAKIDNKADKATTLDGYGITDAYTKDNIDSKLAQKSDILTFDTTPTADSTNPVTSGGVKVELDKKVDKEDGKGLSTNDYTTAEKSKVANLPDDTNTELSKKADKSVFFVGGFEGGLNASVESGGGAIGKNSKATSGGAIGENANTTSGGSVGANSNSDTGGAIGTGAQTSNGFAGGYNAKTVNASGSRIDAVQLGTGTNSEEKTAQFYDYKMMKADGNIPVERLTELKKLSVPHTTASGYPISVSDHLEGERVIDYKVYGNSVQDGTPTPDTPIEIQSVGDLVTDTSSPYYGKYDVPIVVYGKNLFDMATALPEDGWVLQDDGSYYAENSGITKNKVLWENTEGYAGQLKIIYQFKYLKSSSDSSKGAHLVVNYTDDTHNEVFLVKNEWNANTWYSPDLGYTLTNSSKVVKNIAWTYGTGGNSTWVKDIMVTKDLSVTEYEPYIGETKHIYLDEPLRKVGDYADYVDWENQVVVRKTKEGIYTGAENWLCNNTTIYLSIKNLADSVSCYSTHFLSQELEDTINPYFRPVSGVLRLYQENNILYSSADEFKTYLTSQAEAGTPVKVIYPLATPTTEPITAPDFDVPISEGMNVSSGTVIPPSSMDVTYYQDINKVITELKNAILAQGGNV